MNLIFNKKAASLAIPPSLILLVFFSFNLVTAENLTIEYPQFDTLQVNEGYNLSVYNINSSTGVILIGSNCSARITNPFGNIIYNSPNFTLINNYHNLFIGQGNFSSINKINLYIYCVNQNVAGTSSRTFEVSSIINDEFPFYLTILLIAAGLIVLGLWIEDAWVIIIGSMGFTFVGLYTLRFGIDGIRNLTYSYAISIIILFVAAYLVVRSVMELIKVE